LPIPELSVKDMTLDASDTGAVMDSLTPDGNAGVYTLSLGGVSAAGYVAVTVSKIGYHLDPPFRTTEVLYKPAVKSVAFMGLIANGSTGTATITQLSLTFNKQIDGMAVDNITLSGDTGAASMYARAPDPARETLSVLLDGGSTACP
jgi:hypothetical protein